MSFVATRDYSVLLLVSYVYSKGLLDDAKTLISHINHVIVVIKQDDPTLHNNQKTKKNTMPSECLQSKDRT